jgi:hypothetical protein
MHRTRNAVWFSVRCQRRSEGMTNYAYARGANCKGPQNYAKVLFIYFIFTLQLNRNFFIILFEIRRCSLFVHTTRKFNEKIMKIAQGHLNKKFHMKK